MEVAPLPNITPKESYSEIFDIKQGQKIYKLKIEIINENISLILSKEKTIFEQYEINLNFYELKQIHTAFSMLASCQEFIEYIKALIKNNKLKIKKENENQISIEIIVEYLFKQNTIKIDLKSKSINMESIVKDMHKQLSILNERLEKFDINYKELKKENISLKDENNILKEDNKNMNNEIVEIKKSLDIIKSEIIELRNENNSLKQKLTNIEEEKAILSKNSFKINSSIMNEEEFDFIKRKIEEKKNSKIKQIKKIYQATIDGGEPKVFHNKCDNIKNTLVLYESKGKRRFGGFTSESWASNDGHKSDKNCFLFSLDNKKIFSIKDENYYKIACDGSIGPSFVQNGTYCIVLYGNAFDEDSLRTCENIHENIFNGENKALSEDGYFNGVTCKECEVFQILFN